MLINSELYLITFRYANALERLAKPKYNGTIREMQYYQTKLMLTNRITAMTQVGSLQQQHSVQYSRNRSFDRSNVVKPV